MSHSNSKPAAKPQTSLRPATPVPVLHRKYSHFPIEIPVPQTSRSLGQSAGDPISPAELERLREKFKHTTPQGRELVRKLLHRARRKFASERI